jgi:hypothetical protein
VSGTITVEVCRTAALQLVSIIQLSKI